MLDSSSHPDVFMLTHEFYPKRGGIATFTEEMALAAAKLGHQVEVWAQRADAAIPCPDWPFKVKRLKLRGSHSLPCLWTMARTLIHERHRWRSADLNLCEPGPMLAFMLLPDIEALRPRRLLLTVYGSEILRFHANPLTRWLTRRLIRRADRIGAITHYTESLLLRHFPEAAPKVVRILGGPRSDLSVNPHPPGGRDPERIVVLTVGRIHPRKGQLLTLQALAALPDELKARVDYHIVGTASRPEHERPVREAAATSGINVRFLGSLSDTELTTAYREADIFAMNSIEHGHSVEGFGLVYLEASLQGLPVVAHNNGGVPEAVVDGETGLLAPVGDRAALTGIFSMMIRDPELRRRLGEAGRKWAQSHDWSRAAQSLFGP